VTICSDTPAQVKRGRKKHGAKAVMLADPDLTVTERYGLRQERMIAPKPGVSAALPIPATFLVDAAGIVRWSLSSSLAVCVTGSLLLGLQWLLQTTPGF